MARSQDLRERALAAFASDKSGREVAELFGISRATLYRWQTLQEQGQSLAPLSPPGAVRTIRGEAETALRAQLAAYPDATVDEHVARWQREQGQTISRSAMGRALLWTGWTRKKRAFEP